MPRKFFTEVRGEWKKAWQSPGFRRKTTIGLILVIIISSLFPFFFQAIERRNGYLLDDPLLRWTPAKDVSLAIFIVIWTITLVCIARAAQSPLMFLSFIWSWIVLTAFRLLTITLVPLDPPIGLIGLVDPFSNFFYGKHFVTRDLFFSGHTSTVFLLFLCVRGRPEKLLALLATIVVAVLLLVQHVHYTLDVLAAPVFAWVAYSLVRKLIVSPEVRQLPL